MIRRPPRSTLFPYTNALPIWHTARALSKIRPAQDLFDPHPEAQHRRSVRRSAGEGARLRSEEHTSELQSQSNLVCRLLLEKKKENTLSPPRHYRRPYLRPTVS